MDAVDLNPTELVRINRYGAGENMRRHCDGRARISLVLAGALRETAGKREVDAGALCVAVKSADALHETRFGPEGARLVSIDLERFAGGEWSIPRWRWLTHAELRDELRALVAAVIELRAAPGNPDALDGLSEACLVLLDRLNGSAPIDVAPRRWLRDVRRRIDSAPEQPLPVTRLARDAGVSATHLTRSFKAIHGCTVVDYRTRQRVRRALQRLSRPDQRLVDVALDAGFHDQAHFTRHFRSITGVTPGAWRRHLLTV